MRSSLTGGVAADVGIRASINRLPRLEDSEVLGHLHTARAGERDALAATECQTNDTPGEPSLRGPLRVTANGVANGQKETGRPEKVVARLRDSATNRLLAYLHSAHLLSRQLRANAASREHSGQC
jgi:hypothetical protein